MMLDMFVIVGQVGGEALTKDHRTTEWIDTHRLTVVVGHFGSGKTEFSVNLAINLAERGYSTAVADLDIVDPYFRSRECGSLFANHQIRLISSSQACIDADVPSIPPEVTTLFDNKDIHGVLDIGGDASGARVLARFRQKIASCNAHVFCVINANRPLTNTPESAIAYIRSIEDAAGLHINGLVNNTHLCGQTELQDIITGAELTSKISAATGISVICHIVSQDLVEDAMKYVHPVFPVKLYMKKPWE